MKLLSIQYLRAVAVLLVVYAHAIDLQMLFVQSRQQHFYFLENFGAIGVDIFFVISGFIIAYIVTGRGGIKESLSFLKKRFIRINPLFYIACVVYILVMRGQGIHYGTNTIAKTITLLPFFDTGTDYRYPVLRIGWTLSFEWFFYVLFAAFIALKVKRKSAALVATLAAFTVVKILLPINAARYVFVTNPIVWEFCFGVLIAYLYKKYTFKKYVPAVLITAALLWFTCLIYGGYGDVSESQYVLNGQLSWLRVLLWGVPSALLVMGGVFFEKQHTAMQANKLLLITGNASYSIYLTHAITFKVLEMLLEKYYIKFPANGDLLIFLLVVLAVATGIFYYYAVEKNIIKLFTLLFVRKPA